MGIGAARDSTTDHRGRSGSLSDFLIEEWLPTIESTIRATTLINYRTHIERHIAPRLGSQPLESLDGRSLNRLYADLLTNGRLDGKGALSRTTVRRIHATIHRALRDAVRWGRLDTNPADNCDPPRERADDVKEMQTWTTAELRTFLDHVRDDQLFPMWILFATTGMRRGEVLGLRWSDVDLERHQLAVRQSLVVAGSERKISRPKTSRGRRVIALDKTTVEVLADHLQRRVNDKSSGSHKRADDLVFCLENGASLDPNRVSKLFVKRVAGSGLPRIRLHDLRHTHATLALQLGLHPKIVSERLLHATVSMTLDVYSHALQSMQQEAAVQLGQALFGE